MNIMRQVSLILERTCRFPAAMPSQRLFVALALPPGVRARLTAQQPLLRRGLPNNALSVVPAANLHLTLHFLGEVEDGHIEVLAAALEASCREFMATSPPLTLKCQGVGAFPDVQRPRVVWAGVSAPGNSLEQLCLRMAVTCAPFTNQPEDKRFSPHVTLARVRHLDGYGRQILMSHIQTGAGLDFGSWEEPEVMLMQSELGSSTARYSIMRRFPTGS